MTAVLRKYSLLILVVYFSYSHAAWAAPKNIIFLIGDGMGFEQVKAAGIYSNGQPGTFLYESFPYQAQVTTYSADSSVTDSAAAATAMATKTKVNNGVISMSIPGDNSELYTLLEHFRDQGKRTGLVTTTTMSHATPAAFGAHETSRLNYTDIVSDYLTQTRPNVLFGGALHMSISSAETAGYKVVSNVSDMQNVNTNTINLLSGQFGGYHLPYEYDESYGTLPHLSEMTATALEILDNDPDGFFLMVESGRIDHAGHENNIARNIFETIELNNTVASILTWAQGNSDTLIILTTDHETGGLTVLNNNGQGVLPDISWSTTGHTSVNVPVYAIGENAYLVSGTMDNTDFFDLVTFSSTTTVNYYCDEDMDGYVSSAISGSCTGAGCEPIDCEVTTGNDCDDNNTVTYPGAPELCDGIDNDCDSSVPANETDNDLDGYRICEGDCNDSDSGINPGASEACYGKDNESIVVKEDTWKYDIENTGTTWMNVGYDDSDWLTGSGIFGTESSASGYGYTITTPVSNLKLSMFFRKSFTVCDPSEVTALSLNSLFDDGIAVYINGTQVYFAGTSGDPPVWDGSAINHEAINYEALDLTSVIGLSALQSLLVPGNNVLAVGVYNLTDGSSDIVWDGELVINAVGSPCNGLDDDCDGLTDEDFVVDTGCYLPGACEALNTPSSCTGGVESVCSTGTPSTEVCEGSVDENCDGIVDDRCDCINGDTRPTTCGVGECGATGVETCAGGVWGGDTCSPGTPTIETCDHLDNNCDGNIDENLTQPTSCGVGECVSAGIETCTSGIWDGDTCSPGTPTTETCDNLDNNCDGSIDENLTQPTSCGVGECGSSGIETCTAGIWGGDTCSPGTPTTEICDHLDNNCDGSIDESLIQPTTCGVGECGATGIETCTGGVWGGDTCSPGTPTTEVCDNLDNNCDGSIDEDLTQPTSCGVGECGSSGIETCTAGIWGGDTCSPGTPTTETCDNLDNNCDGSIDEDLTQPTSCGVGECGSSGIVTCTAGIWGGDTCSPGTPTTEVCDNLDNNCDGSIDENLTQPTSCGVGECGSSGIETCTAGIWGGDTCSPGTPTTETCDNLDNNCDGSIDEDLTQPTSCGVGECGSSGIETCTAGIWGGDTCSPGTPTTETCDNLDNNCDGSIDEDLTQPTSCGVGECGSSGIETCTAGIWGGDTCSPGTPTTEVCDNLDNNCDGNIDEDLTQPTSCGVGECGSSGIETCTSGIWGGDTCSPGTPTTETCDNLDNNCDGSIDENLTQPTSCGVGECGSSGIETCTAGIWGGDTCSPGTPTTEVCDNLDNNCDGSIDEDLTQPTSCGVGECGSSGIETCTSGIWGGDTCSPGTPTTETCDNLDNNCDGSIDENLTQPTSCGVGECGSSGIETCTAGIWGGDTCSPGTPTTETCDNLDNNCDGSIDEDLTQPTSCGVGECGSSGIETCTAGIWGGDTCSPGTPTTETCDNLDNNCDGSIDEDLTQPTSCGVGECGSSGIETCTAGIWGGDTCSQGTPETEGPLENQSCNDNLDNDCDGNTDIDDSDCYMDDITCFDGEDNDGNGFIDCADPYCEGARKPDATLCGTEECLATGELICNGGSLTNTCEPLQLSNGINETCYEGLYLSTGWHIISLPFIPLESNIETVLAHISGMYLHVWSYEGNTDCEWKIYPYQSGYGPLVCELSEMTPGKGYWIEIIEDTNLITSGLTSQKTITLKKGWNLIGFNSAQSLQIEDALLSITDKYVSVWSFDEGHWKVYDPANPEFSDLQTMMPYHGYWINALEETDWTLP